MSVVSIDERGRLTLPAEVREKLDSDRFLVILDGDSVRLMPVPSPEEARGSVKIPWSIEELEEAGEEFVRKRVEG